MWSLLFSCTTDDTTTADTTDSATSSESATTDADPTGDTEGVPSTADTGTVAPSSGDTSTAHTGSTSTADTGAPPVLPSCDLISFAPSQTLPVSVGLDELRSAWIVNRPWAGPDVGIRSEVLGLAGGERVLAVNLGGAVNLFAWPRTGEITPLERTQACGFSPDDWGAGDLVGDPGDDLHDGEYALSPYFDPALQLPPPSPPESYRETDVALSDMVGWYAVSSTIDVGNWDGAGKADLLYAWDGGSPANGPIPRQPQAPYPFGGAAVYTGPLDRRIGVLGSDAPDAWYDVSAYERVNGLPWSGGMSIFVDDVDGDGLDDVFVDGFGWGNIAARDAPEPPGYNRGGMALFSGGRPGLNALGDERLLLAAVCDSDTLRLGLVPTRPYPAGDLDGDGRGDVVLVGDDVNVNFGYGRHVAFVLTRMDELTGLHTYTEASGTVIDLDGDMSFDALALGDLNGDGADELVLGLWPERVALWLSPLPTGPVTVDSASLMITGAPSSSAEMGSNLSAGDLDGDGYDELILGDPYGRGGDGEVSVVPGSAIRTALGL